MKRYRDYNSYLREIFGERVQKISIDAGLNCPNRDGTISMMGCLFCDSRGSGSGAMIHRGLGINDQIRAGRKFAAVRYGAKKFIAYFQSFTNTYAPVSKLKILYEQALDHEGMVGLSVGTRPDCIDEETVDLLSSYKRDYLVWLELGLQSAHNSTLSRINRGHDVASFDKSLGMANDSGLNVCAHVILGLPGETQEMMMETALFLAERPINGVKIHMLYVVKDTPLATLYEKGEYHCLDRDAYIDLVVHFLELLPPDMVIQRLTGDPVSSELVAPFWAKEKTENLRLFRERLKEYGTWQGKRYRASTIGK